VEVERIPSAAIDLDVLGIRAESLHGTSHVERNLGLMGTQEDLNSERSAIQRIKVFRLNVLEINKQKAIFQLVLFGPTDIPSSSNRVGRVPSGTSARKDSRQQR
jgi:hypothetical protein